MNTVNDSDLMFKKHPILLSEKLEGGRIQILIDIYEHFYDIKWQGNFAVIVQKVTELSKQQVENYVILRNL